LLAVVALLAWGALSLASTWVRSQYYVGSNAGEVAIFQGLSQEVGPIRLSELYTVPGGLPVDSLPTLYKNQVESTIAADDVEDAQEIVSTLRRQACRAAEENQPEPEPTTSPTTEPTPDAEPTNPRGTVEPTESATDPAAAGAAGSNDEEPDDEESTAQDPGDDATDEWISPAEGLDCTGESR
jgi:protein phosphatase